jgi:thioester reductase-like protein
LSPEAFAQLADEIDVIYHCGSKITYIAPYEFLKAPNVLGTHEALRLAALGRTKPLHYVSSIGILVDYKVAQGFGEADDLDATKVPPIGYFQSKYIAERLCRIARDRGMPVTIARIGMIVGDSRTGVSNADDFIARLLIGSIQAGYAPDVHTNTYVTPVDWVSKAMIYLSRQQASIGKTFHLLNPQPVHWSDLFDMAIDVGYPVTKLPFAEWVTAVEQSADPETNPLVPLLPFLHINFARRMTGVSNDAFFALGTSDTQAALEDASFTCAPIDHRYMSLYLGYFIRNGRLNGTMSQEFSF